LLIALEQERLSRRKHAVEESPATALRYCLDYAGIDIADVDVLALGSDHDRLAGWLGLTGEARRRVLAYDEPSRLFPDDLFKGRRPKRIQPFPHHMAHAASAFWPSGFDECAIIVIDAMGEDTATSIAVGHDSGVEIIETYGIDCSLGFYYECASEFIGLGRHDGGKLMGLASYGRPKYDVGLEYEANKIVWRHVPPSSLAGRALIKERSAELSKQFARSSFPYAPWAGESILAYADFAASVQLALENVILKIAERAKKLTGMRRVALAGGVALNCSANGRLARSGIFDDVYIQPMADDAGVGLGAALLAAWEAGTDLRGRAVMRHAYWGAPITAANTVAAFESAGLAAVEMPVDKLLTTVVDVISDGGIVAWGQARSEVGPRSLGARSLLGDPRSRESVVKLNLVKGREMWRPVAPSVPVERFDDFFDGAPDAFMIKSAQVRPEVRHLVPAVVHVDGSARPQAVFADANPLYHQLLLKFEEVSSVPILVNTSLNVAEDPVALSEDDVIEAFRKSEADAVVLGQHIAFR
jgi:carbamoyltransferase